MISHFCGEGAGTGTKTFLKSELEPATIHYGSTTMKRWNIIRKNNLPGNHRGSYPICWCGNLQAKLVNFLPHKYAISLRKTAYRALTPLHNMYCMYVYSTQPWPLAVWFRHLRLNLYDLCEGMGREGGGGAMGLSRGHIFLSQYFLRLLSL